jgi:hypothetical protein
MVLSFGALEGGSFTVPQPAFRWGIEDLVEKVVMYVILTSPLSPQSGS